MDEVALDVHMPVLVWNALSLEGIAREGLLVHGARMYGTSRGTQSACNIVLSPSATFENVSLSISSPVLLTMAIQRVCSGIA